MSCPRGLWAFPSGEVYVGGFHNNARQSQTGWIWLPDSSVFVGSWDNDAPSDYGVFYAKNINDPILRHLTKSATQGGNAISNENIPLLDKIETATPATSNDNNNVVICTPTAHTSTTTASTTTPSANANNLLSANFLWNIFRRGSNTNNS